MCGFVDYCFGGLMCCLGVSILAIAYFFAVGVHLLWRKEK